MDLLNEILSFDTKNGRPQVALRGPRDRIYGESGRRVSVPQPLPLPPAYVMQQQQLAAMQYHNQYRGYHQQHGYMPMVSFARHSPVHSLDRDEFGRLIGEVRREKLEDAEIRDISEYIG